MITGVDEQFGRIVDALDAAGLAEVIKHGAICDLEFFEWLEANMHELLARDPDALAYAMVRMALAIRPFFPMTRPRSSLWTMTCKVSMFSSSLKIFTIKSSGCTTRGWMRLVMSVS